MTQKTINEYSQRLEELKRVQKENEKVYNRKQSKKSKKKVMEELIIPLEAKIEEVRK